jgi:hypothetical protein
MIVSSHKFVKMSIPIATPLEEKSYVGVDEQQLAVLIADRVSPARIRIAEKEEKEIAKARMDLIKSEAEHFRVISKRRQEQEEAEWVARHPEAAEAERQAKFHQKALDEELNAKKKLNEAELNHAMSEYKARLKREEEEANAKLKLQLEPLHRRQQKETAAMIAYCLMGMSVGLFMYSSL